MIAMSITATVIAIAMYTHNKTFANLFSLNFALATITSTHAASKATELNADRILKIIF